jgi:hypothetical protein
MNDRQTNNFETTVLDGVYKPRFYTNNVDNIEGTSLNEVTHVWSKPVSALTWDELEKKYKMKGSNYIY